MKRARNVDADDINELAEILDDFITHNARIYGGIPRQPKSLPEVYQTNLVYDGISASALLATDSASPLLMVPNFPERDGAVCKVISVAIKGFVLPSDVLASDALPREDEQRRMPEFSRMAVGFATDPAYLPSSTLYKGVFHPRNPSYTPRYKVLMDRMFITPATFGGSNPGEPLFGNTYSQYAQGMVSINNAAGFNTNFNAPWERQLRYLYNTMDYAKGLPYFVDEYYECNKNIIVDKDGIAQSGDIPFVYFVCHTKDLTPGGDPPILNTSNVCFLGSIMFRYTNE